MFRTRRVVAIAQEASDIGMWTEPFPAYLPPLPDAWRTPRPCSQGHKSQHAQTTPDEVDVEPGAKVSTGGVSVRLLAALKRKSVHLSTACSRRRVICNR